MRLTHLFLSAAVLALAPLANAATPELPATTKYFDLSSGETPYDSSLDATLQKGGFETIPLDGSRVQGNAVQWLNRLYYRASGARVYAKGGLHVRGRIDFGSLYKIDGSNYVTHFRTAQHGDLVFFFEGMSDSAAREIVKNLTRTLGQKISYRPLRKFEILMAGIPTACAADGTNYFCQPDAATKPSFTTEALSVLKTGGKCVLDVAKGVWAATGGFVISVAHAAIHPVETFHKIVGGVRSFANFMGNFREEFGELWDGLKGLPDATKAQILCELAGGLAAGSVVASLTFGAGSVVLFRQMAMAVRKTAAGVASAGVAASLTATAVKLEARAANVEKTLAAQKSAAAAGESLEDVAAKAGQRESKAYGTYYGAAGRKWELIDRKPATHVTRYNTLGEDLAWEWRSAPIKDRIGMKGIVEVSIRDLQRFRNGIFLTDDSQELFAKANRELAEALDFINYPPNSGIGLSEKAIEARMSAVRDRMNEVIAVMKRPDLKPIPPAKGWLNTDEMAELETLTKSEDAVFNELMSSKQAANEARRNIDRYLASQAASKRVGTVVRGVAICNAAGTLLDEATNPPLEKVKKPYVE